MKIIIIIVTESGIKGWEMMDPILTPYVGKVNLEV